MTMTRRPRRIVTNSRQALKEAFVNGYKAGLKRSRRSRKPLSENTERKTQSARKRLLRRRRFL